MEPEREWENWPGRGRTEASARGKLRALFTPTDEDEAAIEALIEQRGRELEERAAELSTIVADLQRREDETRRLRDSVEGLLREGSAELDERHAQLAALSAETARREQELSALGAALEERRQELGAVELRRAAVERKEEQLVEQQHEVERLRTEVAERIVDVESRLAELERRRVETERQTSQATALGVEIEARRAELDQRREALARREAELEELRAGLEEARAAHAAGALTGYEEHEHVLLVPGAGYRLLARPGPAPEAGVELELEDQRYRVMRVGRSALPGDRRPSAFLERIDAR